MKSRLTFHREKDGSVTITNWLRGYSNSGHVDQGVVDVVDVVDREWTFTPEEWAAEVTRVSVEDSENRVKLALWFHRPPPREVS